MTTLREAASGLLEAVVAAIESGDWKVDGACDPTVDIIRLKNILAKPEQGNSNSNYPNTESNTPFVDAVNISQERVDETVKSEHEPWCDSVTKLLLSLPPQIPPCNCKPKREWVELTKEDMPDGGHPMFDTNEFYADMAWAAAKLKEKNT